MPHGIVKCWKHSLMFIKAPKQDKLNVKLQFNGVFEFYRKNNTQHGYEI